MFHPPSIQSVAEMRTNKGNSFGHVGSNCRNYLTAQSGSILERAAVIVLTFITKRRQKFVNQITMRSVDLDDTKTGLTGTARCCCKSSDYFLNAFSR